MSRICIILSARPMARPLQTDVIKHGIIIVILKRKLVFVTSGIKLVPVCPVCFNQQSDQVS